MYDPRPKRIKRPSKWLVLVGILCIPACLSIPIVGWSTLVIGGVMTIRQYRQASEDEKLPFGHFRGEGRPTSYEEAPKGLSIFKD